MSTRNVAEVSDEEVVNSYEASEQGDDVFPVLRTFAAG